MVVGDSINIYEMHINGVSPKCSEIIVKIYKVCCDSLSVSVTFFPIFLKRDDM